MKSAISTRIAAALIPVAALFAAGTAAAQVWVQPGVYVQPGVTIQAQVAPAYNQGYGYRYGDHRPPQVVDVTPNQGERVSERGWTEIRARVVDQGSGIDPRSIVMRVDGRDVTYRTRFDGDDVRYSENLQPGRHYAEIVVRDRLGNGTRYAWNFDVMHDRGHGWGHRGDRPYAQNW